MKFSQIFQVLVPKDKKFIPIFEQAAQNTVKAAEVLVEIFKETDKSVIQQKVRHIKELEKIGDNYTHTIFDELNKTFITPFDREDIYKLNSSLDDVIDLINESAKKLLLNNPKTIPHQFLELAEQILLGAMEMRCALAELKNLKHPEKIKQSCIRINEIENVADEIYHKGISDLFENEKDAIELIKKRDILSLLEAATDKAEDVSDMIKTLIIKTA
jgi:predicted phosphate transport protein (TIGR00153 family)